MCDRKEELKVVAIGDACKLEYAAFEECLKVNNRQFAKCQPVMKAYNSCFSSSRKVTGATAAGITPSDDLPASATVTASPPVHESKSKH